MGQVFLAGAPDGRLVAFKLVHAQHVEEPGFRERFRREVAASRRVSGAYTAPVMDADVETEIPWLVTVFVPGPSLRQAIEAAGPLPADPAARLAAGLAAALGEIHAAGLVHRDLKPSNVLLAADGPRVIDFGVARAADGHTSELTHTGYLVGSPGYMSPEQAESKALTPASDVFSLGSVVYMACTGVEPFMGASTPATLYNVVHAEPDLAAVPERLRGVIAACLAKDPAARPAPAEVLALIGAVPAVTRTWPDAVHALIAEQDAAVVTALREQGGSPDVAVVPLLPASAESHTSAFRAPEGSTEPGVGPRRKGSRRVLTAGLAAAALLVGGTAAAVAAMGSHGSPTAAPISTTATSAPADPVVSVATSTDPASVPAPVASTPPAAVDTRPSPPAPASRPTSTGPACITGKEAYSAAKELNLGSLPSDARINVLRCDGTWATAQLLSVSYGNAAVVYDYQSGAWKAVDLGSGGLCGGPVAKAPLDIRRSVNC
jgi:hypothetical protein